jgi:hypothetical protein
MQALTITRFFIIASHTSQTCLSDWRSLYEDWHLKSFLNLFKAVFSLFMILCFKNKSNLANRNFTSFASKFDYEPTRRLVPHSQCSLRKNPKFLQNFRSINNTLKENFNLKFLFNIYHCNSGSVLKSKNYYIAALNWMYFIRENSQNLRQKHNELCEWGTWASTAFSWM